MTAPYLAPRPVARGRRLVALAIATAAASIVRASRGRATHGPTPAPGPPPPTPDTRSVASGSRLPTPRPFDAGLTGARPAWSLGFPALGPERTARPATPAPVPVSPPLAPPVPVSPPLAEVSAPSIFGPAAPLPDAPAPLPDATTPVPAQPAAAPDASAPVFDPPVPGTPVTAPVFRGWRLPQLAWIAIYAVAIVAPLALVLLPHDAPPRPFLVELASALGIAALSLLAVQLALPARLPLLASLGAEVAVRLHRRTADILGAAVAAHVAAVMVADPSRLELLRFFGEPWRAQAAIGSCAALIVLTLTSVLRRRVHLSYAAWRGIHLVAGALALVLAVVHTVGVGRYLVHDQAGWSLVALTVVGVGALVVMRAPWLRPWSVRPYLVDRIVRERGGAITLRLRADGHLGQRFHPGQFAWLKVAGTRALLAEHPFSYSGSAVDPVCPEFTMQPRAGFSARAAGFEPGTRLLVDGPHGAFRPSPRTAGTVLIAGGIGITPSMSVLRTAADRRDRAPFLLLYAARTLESMPFLAEIQRLEDSLQLRSVLVLSSPDPEWPGERGRINPGVLDRHLPSDLRHWQFLVCGSGPFVDGVMEALEAVGVPGERVHAERFVEV
jgi:predicted ferric reductase